MMMRTQEHITELLRIARWGMRWASSFPPGELRDRALAESAGLGEIAADLYETRQQLLAALHNQPPITLRRPSC